MTSATAGAAPRLAIFGRVLAAVLGGYAFCWGLAAIGTAGFYGLGMHFHDAEHLSGILAVLAYVGVFLWAFGARRMRPVWAVLLGGAVVMSALASLIQSRILA